ncbi:MAG: 5-(carboxyamino)imidazole ribonucleotide mutase [Alkalispirochaeta sp.]
MIGIIMGSVSDAGVMDAATETCEQFGYPYEMTVVSAHRTPDRLVSYARDAADRGIEVIIAGAGGAAHLPGMVAAMTPLPVIGVPVQTRALHGLDSLLSIVQMPKGVPVATVAIDGARNAALLALRIIGVANPGVRHSMQEFLDSQRAEVEGTLGSVSRTYPGEQQ